MVQQRAAAAIHLYSNILTPPQGCECLSAVAMDGVQCGMHSSWQAASCDSSRTGALQQPARAHPPLPLLAVLALPRLCCPPLHSALRWSAAGHSCAAGAGGDTRAGRCRVRGRRRRRWLQAIPLAGRAGGLRTACAAPGARGGAGAHVSGEFV